MGFEDIVRNTRKGMAVDESGRPMGPVPVDEAYARGIESQGQPNPALGGTWNESFLSSLARRVHNVGQVAGSAIMGRGGIGAPGGRSSQELGELAKAAKAGDQTAAEALVQHFKPIFDRIGQKTRPVTSTQEPAVSGQDISQRFQVILQQAIKRWNPQENPNFEAHVLASAKKAPGMAKQMETMVPRGTLDRTSRRVLELTDEWEKQHGTSPLAKDEIKRDTWIARKLDLDWRPFKTGDKTELQARQEAQRFAYDQVRDARLNMGREQRARGEFADLDQLEAPGSAFEEAEELPKTIIQKAGEALKDPIDQQIMKLRSEGVSVREIGKRLGINHSNVVRRVQRMGKKIEKSDSGFDKLEGGPKGGPIGGGQGAGPDDPWGSKPTRQGPVRPRELGLNAREQETNPRFTGDNPRFVENLAEQSEGYFRKGIESAGLRYDGVTDIGKGRKAYWYTDPRTGSTGLVRDGKELQGLGAHIDEHRLQFKDTPPPTTPPRSVGAMGAGDRGDPHQYDGKLDADQRVNFETANNLNSRFSGGSQPYTKGEPQDWQAIQGTIPPPPTDQNRTGFGSLGLPLNNPSMFHRFLKGLLGNVGVN